MILVYGGSNEEWEIHKADRAEWINSNINDGGFYFDVTDSAKVYSDESHRVDITQFFDMIALGNKDTMFLLEHDEQTISYYVGHLKSC
jgi:hypothetical protein